MKVFEKLSTELSDHPRLKLYASQIDIMKYHVKSFFHKYALVTQMVQDWCGRTTPLLGKYLDEGNSKSSENGVFKVQGILSLSTLLSGIMKMETAQIELGGSQFKLNKLLLRIVELELKVKENYDSETPEFQQKHVEYYRLLENIVKALELSIGQVKHNLNNDVHEITDMKITIKHARGLIALNDHRKLQHEFYSPIAIAVKESYEKCFLYAKQHK